jgi:phenylacetate-CoA ligase
LEESQWWTKSRIQEYQAVELQRVVKHAYTTVPYYRRVFDQHGVRPEQIQSRADLSKLPLLSKEDVREHLRHMVSSHHRKSSLLHGHTSGSTGKSLDFYMEPRAIQFRWAVWWRYMKRFGIAFDEPYATFTGQVAVPLGQTKPPFWRENQASHQTIFTMHHLTRASIRAVVNRLNEGHFAYYVGYPSILNTLAELIQDEHLQITKPPRVVFTGAETLYEPQVRLLSSTFGCIVTDQYGFSEGCGNASRCECGVYHEDFEYGILETVDEERVDDGHYRGKVVATGFGSYGMPFLRYEVGDAATWTSGICTCGRQSQLITRIDGRTEDYVITPEGRRVMRFDYIFKDARHVREAQVLQSEQGKIVIRVVRRPAYSAADEEHLRREVAARISQRLLVDFEYVDEIGREALGKFRAVKSYVGTRSVSE